MISDKLDSDVFKALIDASDKYLRQYGKYPDKFELYLDEIPENNRMVKYGGIPTYYYKKVGYSEVVYAGGEVNGINRHISVVIDRGIITGKSEHTCVWKQYLGLTERYEYCEKCNAKR